MEIEFDPAKSERNLRERGFGFERAALFEFDTALIWIGDRIDYLEKRYATLGLVEGRLHALIFPETDFGIRIISLRKANQREAKRYERQ